MARAHFLRSGLSGEVPPPVAKSLPSESSVCRTSYSWAATRGGGSVSVNAVFRPQLLGRTFQWNRALQCARVIDVQTLERLDLESDEFEFFLDELQLSFSVEFSESDISEVETAGDLFDIVIRQMGGFDTPRCLTSLAFYRLRRSLIEVSGVDRQSILPATSLRGLLPPRLRRAWWQVIESGLRLRVPRMRPGRAAIAAHSALVALGLMAWLLVVAKMVSWEAGIIAGSGTPVLIWFLWKGASRLPREFPADTFGDLVRMVVKLNQAKLMREAGGSTVNQAWTAFRELLGRESGVPAAAISREMRFERRPA